MKKLNLGLSFALVIGMVLAVACGGGAASTATVTVTKTAAATTVTVTPTAGAAPTATVTQTAAPVTLTVTPTPPPTKLVKVTMADAAAGTGRLISAVGMDKGFFNKRGIDLGVVEMATAASKLAPFVGQADVANGDTTAYYAERKDTRIIGPFFSQHWGVFVRKDSPYQSYQDLKGKKIANVSKNVSAYWTLQVVLKNLGLAPEKDFNIVYGEPAVQIGWLLKGEVEAIHIYEPGGSSLLTTDGDKVREIYWLNDYFKSVTGIDWLHGGIYTTDVWVKQNPELARQLGLAYEDTMRYIYANEQVWKSDLTKKMYSITDPKQLEIVAQRLPRIVQVPPYGPTYKNALVKKAGLLAGIGILPPEAVDWYKGMILFAEPW